MTGEVLNLRQMLMFIFLLAGYTGSLAKRNHPKLLVEWPRGWLGFGGYIPPYPVTILAATYQKLTRD